MALSPGALIVGKVLLYATGIGILGYGLFIGGKWVQSQLPTWKEKINGVWSKITDPFGLKKALTPKATLPVTSIPKSLPIAQVIPATDWNKVNTNMTTTTTTAINAGKDILNTLIKEKPVTTFFSNAGASAAKLGASMPKITLPTFNIPKLNIPKIELPKIDLTKFQIPKLPKLW